MRQKVILENAGICLSRQILCITKLIILSLIKNILVLRDYKIIKK